LYARRLVQSVLWSSGSKLASKLDLHTKTDRRGASRVCKGAEFFDYYVFELVTKNPDHRHNKNQKFSGSMDRYNDIDNHLFAFTLLLLILAFCIFFICCSKKHNQENPRPNVSLTTTPKPDSSTFLSENPPGYHTCTKGTSKLPNSNSNSCISYSPPHTPLPDYSIAMRGDDVVCV
jgi:hypothetical protein